MYPSPSSFRSGGQWDVWFPLIDQRWPTPRVYLIEMSLSTFSRLLNDRVSDTSMPVGNDVRLATREVVYQLVTEGGFPNPPGWANQEEGASPQWPYYDLVVPASFRYSDAPENVTPREWPRTWRYRTMPPSFWTVSRPGQSIGGAIRRNVYESVTDPLPASGGNSSFSGAGVPVEVAGRRIAGSAARGVLVFGLAAAAVSFFFFRE